jgi:hypothetical protein
MSSPGRDYFTLNHYIVGKCLTHEVALHLNAQLLFYSV